MTTTITTPDLPVGGSTENELTTTNSPHRPVMVVTLNSDELPPSPLDPLAVWEDAIPESVITLADDDTLRWRQEVKTGRNGRLYWQWRTGTGPDRKSRYGGTFTTLSLERQNEYHRNAKRRHAKAARRQTKNDRATNAR